VTQEVSCVATVCCCSFSRAMPEFIAVRCCECSLWQVVQRRKPQGRLGVSKWSCRVCGKAQSVTAVAGAAQQAAALRPLVQELNLTGGQAKAAAEQNPAPLEERVAVRVPFDPVWDRLMPEAESSDSESGEAVALVRGDTAGRKRQRKTPKQPKAKAAIEHNEEEEAVAVPAKKAAPPKRQEREQDEEDGEEGVTWTRQQQLEVVQDEVWNED
jgi:hypothetical protein